MIFLVNRGKCPFTQKVRNCQNKGANLAIIMDNIDEGNYHIDELIMKDDGTGGDIHIPSILISIAIHN